MPIGGDQSTESERCLSHRSSMQQQGRDAVIHQRTFSIKPRFKMFWKKRTFFFLPAADALKFFTGQKTNSGLSSFSRGGGKEKNCLPFFGLSHFTQMRNIWKRNLLIYTRSLCCLQKWGHDDFHCFSLCIEKASLKRKRQIFETAVN